MSRSFPYGRHCPFCGVCVWSLKRHLTARLRGWLYDRTGINLWYVP